MNRKIIDIWTSVNKAINGEPETSIENFISDCFEYEIFKVTPSNKHKQWFKKCFGINYPIYVSELTPSVIKEIKSTIKIRKKDRQFEEKMSKQRAKRGYADIDVWNLNTWLSDMLSKMLKQFANNCMGHPILDKEGNYIKNEIPHNIETSEEIYDLWIHILNRMSFLAGELNEETCSMKKEHDELINKWWKYYEQFEKEFGNGNSLKTDEEIEYEKKNNVYIAVFPDRHPNKEFVKEYNKASKELRDFEKKMFVYQNRCKNELFDLLKKYYWDLWD